MRNKLFLAAAVAITMASCKKEASPSFTADATEVEVGEVVTFTNTSEDSYNQMWDFGDGTQSEVMNPTHVYGEAGSYTVTLQVTDKKGKENFSATETITVSNSNYDELSEEEQIAREERELAIIGTWNLEEYTQESTDIMDTNSWSGFIIMDIEYDGATVEFMQNGELIYTDDQGNVSTGYWDLTGTDYMTISFSGLNHNFFEIETIGTTMVLKDYEYFTNMTTNDDETRTWTLTMSK